VSQVDPDVPFPSLGADSLTIITLGGELERLLGREVQASVMWDFNTVNRLATHLAQTAP